MKIIKSVLLIILFLNANCCFASSLPINAIMKICRNPIPTNVTKVVSAFGWKRDTGKFAYSAAFGPRWISTIDDMNMSVKMTQSGSLIRLSYRFKTNSYAAENMVKSLPEYGFRLVNNYENSSGETHLIFTNNQYRVEFTIWSDDGMEKFQMSITPM